MANNKTVTVENPNNLPTISYKLLEDLQGDLKILPKENLAKLKKSILQFGFVIPKFVWIHDGHYYILDGHQTKKALASLEAEGYEISPIPYAEVKAKDRQEAAKLLLEINSRYGEYNPETTFFEDFDIDLDLINDIEIPELDIKLEELEEEPKEKEYDENLETENECPRCGYKW
jgi:ParB-like chromosome segregation protein Spo0J